MKKGLFILGIASIPIILTAGTVVCAVYLQNWMKPAFSSDSEKTYAQDAPAANEQSNADSSQVEMTDDVQPAVEEVNAEAVQSVPATGETSSETHKIGESWEVDGQWILQINSVTETDERSGDGSPAAVYIIDYGYMNMGYSGELNISTDNGITLIDGGGELGTAYPLELNYSPKGIAADEGCRAQCAVAVNNSGWSYINISITDSNGVTRECTFTQ